jgi:hypothetical protein
VGGFLVGQCTLGFSWREERNTIIPISLAGIVAFLDVLLHRSGTGDLSQLEHTLVAGLADLGLTHTVGIPHDLSSHIVGLGGSTC